MTSASPPSPDRQWWTDQWLDLINAYRFKKRLERGWKYAREGNVLNIRFQGQKVLAEVQGTEVEPYRVSIWLDPLTKQSWQDVVMTLSQRAIFAAKLLAGEMPYNIEEVFAANGVRLFPFQLADVRSRCSCPDKANPCKHVSAVYYLLGDRFSEDPFVLFQLRGRTREQILQALREVRSSNAVVPEASVQSESSQVRTNETKIPEVYSPELAVPIDRQAERSTKRSQVSPSPATPLQTTLPETIPPQTIPPQTIPPQTIPPQTIPPQATPDQTTPAFSFKNFWRYSAPLDPDLVVITPPVHGETLWDVLEPIPLSAIVPDSEAAKVQQRELMQQFKQIYETVSQQAVLRAMMQGEERTA